MTRYHLENICLALLAIAGLGAIAYIQWGLG